MGINEKFLGVGGGGTTCICDFPSGAGGIALYQLNTNANDTCGNYNANSETNITYSAGKFGNAAQFNGTSSNMVEADVVDAAPKYNAGVMISMESGDIQTDTPSS